MLYRVHALECWAVDGKKSRKMNIVYDGRWFGGRVKRQDRIRIEIFWGARNEAIRINNRKWKLTSDKEDDEE